MGENDWVYELRRITPGTVAECCQVSRSTVLKWIKSGKLKAFRLPGGHFRITADSLLSFLEENKLPISKPDSRVPKRSSRSEKSS